MILQKPPSLTSVHHLALVAGNIVVVVPLPFKGIILSFAIKEPVDEF
jgi:hypothetical protein